MGVDQDLLPRELTSASIPSCPSPTKRREDSSSIRAFRSLGRRWLCVVTYVALLAAGTEITYASVITFEVDYLTTSGQSCSLGNCFPIPPGGIRTRTFILDA